MSLTDKQLEQIHFSNLESGASTLEELRCVATAARTAAVAECVRRLHAAAKERKTGSYKLAFEMAADEVAALANPTER